MCLSGNDRHIYFAANAHYWRETCEDPVGPEPRIIQLSVRNSLAPEHVPEKEIGGGWKMIHRTTLTAVPIISLVVLGAGLGWWGYSQDRQKQAMAQLATNEYAAGFHGLISDIGSLRDETDKALVSTDTTAFQDRLRQMWRLGYAAQSDISRLPAGTIPTTNIQAFLSTLATTTDGWMTADVGPRQKSVHSTLVQISNDCKTISLRLNKLQPQGFSAAFSQLAQSHVSNRVKQDNQMVSGITKLDGIAASYVESSFPLSLPKGHQNDVFRSEPTISQAQAVDALKRFTGLVPKKPWHVAENKNPSFTPTYIVEGSTNEGELFATVSKRGGHVLSFRVNYVPTRDNFDLATLQTEAKKWTLRHDLPPSVVHQSIQTDHTVTITLTPTLRGIPVLSQTMNVTLALDTGKVIGMNATNFYQHPVDQVPQRSYSALQLTKALNPSFHVRMNQNVIVMDKSYQYQPATVFYGTSQDRTFRVLMNANTGKEMDVEILS